MGAEFDMQTSKLEKAEKDEEAKELVVGKPYFYKTHLFDECFVDKLSALSASLLCILIELNNYLNLWFGSF